MASRSRTLLFVQYRNTFGKTKRGGSPSHPPGAYEGTSERAGLISAIEEHVAIQMDAFTPSWVGAVENIEAEMEKIAQMIGQIEVLYKKHMLPGFQEVDFSDIEGKTTDINAAFSRTHAAIQKLASDDAKLSRNIQASLATRLSELTIKFRKSQGTFLSKLKRSEMRMKEAGFINDKAVMDDVGLEGFGEDGGGLFSDQQMASVEQNEAVISEREREINEIVKSIMGLAQVFRELQTMVIDQGTVLDRIDYNIEMTHVAVQDAHEQLTKGDKYSKKSTKMCGRIAIALLIVVIFALIVVIAMKRRK